MVSGLGFWGFRVRVLGLGRLGFPNLGFRVFRVQGFGV